MTMLFWEKYRLSVYCLIPVPGLGASSSLRKTALLQFTKVSVKLVCTGSLSSRALILKLWVATLLGVMEQPLHRSHKLDTVDVSYLHYDP